MHCKTGLAAAAISLLALAGCATPPPGGTSAPPKQTAGAITLPADPLTVLNKRFQAEYAAARAAVIDETSPVIVVAFDELILLRNGTRTVEKFTPPVYHQVKAISHVPLALYVMLQPTLGQPLAPDKIADLKSYRALLATAVASLPGRGLPRDALGLHQAMGNRSLGFIDKALGAGSVDRGDFRRYVEWISPRTLKSANFATVAQLESLHALMGRWRSELSPAEWKALHVVVLGSRQPRQGNLQYAYFRKLMGRRAGNRRLFYAEGVFTEKGARTLLGTILIDRDAAIAFFRNPKRLERDLLADAAARWIRQNM